MTLSVTDPTYVYTPSLVASPRYRIMTRGADGKTAPCPDFPLSTRYHVQGVRWLDMLAAWNEAQGCEVGWNKDGTAFVAEYDGRLFMSAALVEVGT